jgi:hypothetical protein
MAVKKAPAPAAKPQQRQTPRAPKQDAEHNEQSSGNKADLFDKAKATGAVEPGKYEAIIAEMVLQPEDEKGQSVRINVEIATEGEFRGEKLAQFYKCFEANGDPGKGLNFLKRDLAILGKPDVKFSELEDVFQEIVDAQTAILITVKQNGQYTNVYLNGLCEDSAVIDDYLATRGF